ncbi:MAG: phosphate acyltransferase PlsX [Pseudohongiellaceae bacterium]
MHIAIDAMGGDTGVAVTVPAALSSLDLHPDLVLTLVGDESLIQPRLAASGHRDRLKVLHTSQQVTETDKPTDILRRGRQSSLFMSIELVNQCRVQACVSAGNTGAMLLAGRHLLKTIAGIDKPAMLAMIPGATKPTFLLDVGANVDCKASELFQFAVMGAVLAESREDCAKARVGLLNIGAEDHKGSEQVKLAAAMLETCEAINYIGYIEGNGLFQGTADVVVCDGFVGNVTIKSSAGVARVVRSMIDEGLERTWWTRGLALCTAPVLKPLRMQINPGRFNGASLLGLQGSIVKSHGNADSEGFTYAIEQAVREAEKNVPQLIADRVAGILTDTGTAVNKTRS